MTADGVLLAGVIKMFWNWIGMVVQPREYTKND